MNNRYVFSCTLLLACLVAVTQMSEAAPRQCVLVEHFTNTDCGPCAEYNPGIHNVLNAMTRDTVVKISYHAWWPGSGDPFYQYNISENTGRINYYNVSSVPDIFVDHTLQPSPASPTILRSNIRTRYNTTSPCTIQIAAFPSSSTAIHFWTSVTADQDMTGAYYRLYVVLITDLVTYGSPPGSNGETSFPDPMRDMYPNSASGQSFTIANGQTYTMEGNLTCSASWNPMDLSVVVFVQNSNTKEILQANWAEVLPSTGTITLTSPNGGEQWPEGSVQTIQWSTTDLDDSIRIELNRSYPSATWESIARVANTGSYAWTASGPGTANARVRVSGVIQGMVSDTSAANFSILPRAVTVTSPNGGEEFVIGESLFIQWTSQYITGNVDIALNRDYPNGPWETIASNVANSGSRLWTTSGLPSGNCRVRISSIDFPAVTDVSNANFALSINLPPILLHDPLDDQEPAAFTVTARVLDDRPNSTMKLFIRPEGGVYDSIPMPTTGNPQEYAAAVSARPEGEYEYYLRITDAGGAVTLSSVMEFAVASACGMQLAYDDGTGEAAHWSATPGFRWAVKFSPDGGTFALCGARIGIAATRPTTLHTPIVVAIQQADGPGGIPGTVIAEKIIGSIGNVIGGLSPDTANFADIRFRDVSDLPLEIHGDFYIAVENPYANTIEAFLHDTSSVATGNSYVYDDCRQLWINETSADAVARRGNRMIRALGFTLAPPQATAIRSGDDIVIRWNSTGAPIYRVYSSTAANGPFDTFIGSTSATSWTDEGAVSAASKKFYIVRSAAE